MEPRGVEALEVTWFLGGCPVKRKRVRLYLPTEEGYEAANGERISSAELEELRAMVLASRPDPTRDIHAILLHPESYLARLGFDDATLAEHIPDLKHLLLAGYEDEQGNLPAEISDLPLFDVRLLREELVDQLLRAPSPGDHDSVCIDLPGRPWIHIGTTSVSPDCVPWFVVVGDESWYALDRGLARVLLTLAVDEADPSAPGLELLERTDWREELWTNERAWPRLARSVRETAHRHGYRSLPGWSAIEDVFIPSEDPGATTPAAPGGLPAMRLVVRRARVIDQVRIGPSTRGQDWNDVLRALERAEEAAARQPCLAEWKRDLGAKVFLAFASDPGRGPDRNRTAVEDLLRHLGRTDSPAYVLDFGQGFMCWDGSMGDGVLFEDGTLLLLNSRERLPLLPGSGLSRFAETGRYGLVRPGEGLEVHTFELRARGG